MICDRCGQIYTPDKERPRYTVWDNEKATMLTNSLDLDLCPDCAEKLEAWMEQKE